MKKYAMWVLTHLWLWASLGLIALGITAIVYTGTPLGLFKALITLFVGLLNFAFWTQYPKIKIGVHYHASIKHRT